MLGFQCASHKIIEYAELDVVCILLQLQLPFQCVCSSTLKMMCSSQCVHELWNTQKSHLWTLSASGTNSNLPVGPSVLKCPVRVASRAASKRIRSENLQNIQRKTWDVRPGMLWGGRIIETEKECV